VNLNGQIYKDLVNGTVVRLGKYGAVAVKWDGGRQEIEESSTLEKEETP